MGDRRVCNGEYKCELSGANKRLVPDHIDRRVESGSSFATDTQAAGKCKFYQLFDLCDECGVNSC